MVGEHLVTLSARAFITGCQQKAKTLIHARRACTPVEQSVQALEAWETGSGGAGSQPRAQDLQEGDLSCARGMEGSWEAGFCVCSMLGGALGSGG